MYLPLNALLSFASFTSCKCCLLNCPKWPHSWNETETKLKLFASVSLQLRGVLARACISRVLIRF